MREATARLTTEARDGRLNRAAIWTALGTIYVVWGSTYLAIRVMVETAPPLLAAGVRFVLAGAILLLALRIWPQAEPFAASAREVATAVVVGALILFGGIGLLTAAEQRVPSGLAALIIASVPLWIVIIRALVRERPPWPTWVGTGIGFIGVALLVFGGRLAEGAPTTWLLVLLAAAASTAVGSFLSGRARLPANALFSTAVEMLSAGLLMLVVGLAAGEGGDGLGDVSAKSLGALAYLVVVGSVLGYTAFVWLLRNASVSLVSTYAYVNPVVAVILGWAILSEPLGPTVLIASLAILLAVAFVVTFERPSAWPPDAR
jgi:drug/metabolite transporter (DMT)-like permease